MELFVVLAALGVLYSLWCIVARLAAWGLRLTGRFFRALANAVRLGRVHFSAPWAVHTGGLSRLGEEVRLVLADLGGRLRKGAQQRRLARMFRQVRRMEDFGPVIAAAQLARDVPPEDRQVIFYHHRQRLVEHAEACLRSNMTRRSVVSEVEDLVLACAVQRRQIDYIVGAAEARLAKESDFHDMLLDEIRLHKQRVRSIQELHDDPDIIETMLEIEDARHAQAVQRLSGVSGGGMPSGF